jgi:excisionase family DNA binding protein
MSFGHDYDAQFLTADEVATLVRVSVKTVYSWCATGYLPCVKLGRLVRINKDELHAWIEQLRQSSNSMSLENSDGSC